MTHLQSALLYGLALAFYGVSLALLLLGACDLWLDLRERLAVRHAKRMSSLRNTTDWRRRFNHENFNRPSGPPPLRFRRSTHDDSLDAADVISYLRWRNDRMQRALTDDTNPPPEDP